MLKGCALLLLAWAALAAVEWQALIRTSGQESYVQAVLLALSVILGLSGGWAVLGALRLARAARRPLPEWRDGALACASGRLSATGALRTAPLSGTPAVLYEYEATGKAQHRGDASDHKLAQGMGMTPCMVHTPAGPVRLCGFPVPQDFAVQPLPPGATDRLADHLIAAPVRLGKGRGAHFGWPELMATLDDEDGDVRADLVGPELFELIEAERRGREFAARAPAAEPGPAGSPNASGDPVTHGSEDDEDDEDDDHDEEDENAEVNGDALPAGSVATWLGERSGLRLKETAVRNHAEVTVLGTWRADSRRLEVGNPVRNPRRGLTALPVERVVRKELTRALTLTPLWLAIALLAHAYAYPQVAMRWTAGTPLGPLAARVARWNTGADASALPGGAQDAAVHESSNDAVGSLQEINVGRIALVDGLAWTRPGGTVVRLVGKPVAGRRLAGSACPAVHLAALELLRDAPHAQITVDESGRSAYLAYGRHSGPSATEREVGAREWKIRIETRRPDRLAGRLTHSSHGGFRFDLPIAPGAQSGEAAVEPLQPAALVSAHDALRSAVARRDLRALLAAQGFSAVESEALEALPGLRQDLDAFALRFLDADAPADVAMRAEGTSYLLFRGRNPEGRPFANFYHFVGCRGAPVLVKIAVNPQ